MNAHEAIRTLKKDNPVYTALFADFSRKYTLDTGSSDTF